MEVREEIEFTNYIIDVILSIEEELGYEREEASARFESSVVLHFDRADPHNTSTHPNGSDLRRHALSSNESEWRPFLAPVEDRERAEGMHSRLADLEDA